MRIYDNGIYRDMTQDEEKAYRTEIVEQDENVEDKLEKLEQEITATQEALCEIYEQIV